MHKQTPYVGSQVLICFIVAQSTNVCPAKVTTNSRLSRTMKRSILSTVYLLLVSATAVIVDAQYQGRGYDEYQDYDNTGSGYRDYGDGSNNNNNYYYGQDDDGDNLYANYAARQNEKAMGKGGSSDWMTIFMTGIGGYVVGMATTKIGQKKTKKNSNNAGPKLRFKLNQRVHCKIGQGPNDWVMGTVVKLWSQQGPGFWMPYQIQLDDGAMIYAPQDNDNVIRKAT